MPYCTPLCFADAVRAPQENLLRRLFLLCDFFAEGFDPLHTRFRGDFCLCSASREDFVRALLLQALLVQLGDRLLLQEGSCRFTRAAVVA